MIVLNSWGRAAGKTYDLKEKVRECLSKDKGTVIVASIDLNVDPYKDFHKEHKGNKRIQFLSQHILDRPSARFADTLFIDEVFHFYPILISNILKCYPKNFKNIYMYGTHPLSVDTDLMMSLLKSGCAITHKSIEDCDYVMNNVHSNMIKNMKDACIANNNFSQYNGQLIL